MPRRGARDADRGEQLAGRGGRLARAGRQVRDRDACARRADRAQDRPWRRSTTSGPPVSIAGEAFIRFPPIVPLRARRVRPDDRATRRRARSSRSRTSACAASSAWVVRAPSVQRRRLGLADPASSARRWIATMRLGQRPSCPGARRRRGRCRRRPGAAPVGRRARERVVEARGWTYERRARATVRRRPDPLRRHRQLVDAGAGHLGDRVRDRAGRRHASAARRPPSSRSARRWRWGRRSNAIVDRAARRRRSRACSRAGAGCAACRPRRSSCPRASPARCP